METPKHSLRLMNYKSPELVIITPVFNMFGLTALFAEYLFRNTTGEFLWLLVDNGSSTEQSDLLAKLVATNPRTHLIRLPRNSYYSGGINAGRKFLLARSIDPKFVLCCNNDIVLPPEFVKHLTLPFHLDKQVGIVGPRANLPNSYQSVPFPIEIGNSHSQQLMQYYKHNFFISGIVSGCCFLIRWDLLKEVELPEMQMWDDNFICLKAQHLGWKVVVYNHLAVYHLGSQTFKVKGINELDSYLRGKREFLTAWKQEEQRFASEKIPLVGMVRVKNGLPYIRRTLAQMTKICDRIVVLDDHSTDGTASVVQEFSKVKYYLSPFGDFNEARDRN